jgi:hypothetical protein
LGGIKGKTDGRADSALHAGLAGYIAAMRRGKILATMLILVCLIAGLLVGAYLGRFLPGAGGLRTYNTAAILKQVQALSELVTVKYVIEKVVVLEDVKWYGESRVLLLAHGVVKAGVDLGRLKPEDVTVTGTKISLKLPPAQVLDTYLDEDKTQVIERSTGLLRAFDKDLEQTARQNAIDDIRRAARLGGIAKDADQRAREQLKQLFQQLGFQQVEFR